MSHQPNHIYEFGPFRLDSAERMLLRNGEAIPLQPKVFDLLLVLVERHGHLLEKDELMEAVWPDTIVEEVNLANNISILRKTLSENGQQFIETVPKRGYRFVAPVQEFIAQPEVGADVPTPAQGAPSRGVSRLVKRRPAITISLLILVMAGLASVFGFQWLTSRSNHTAPNMAIKSIAVLPFKPLVAESHDEAFQMGMADTLILKLSGLKQLSVRSINSVRKYANPDQDPLAAGREQRVDFVLDSSFQRDGDKIRVTSRLLNVADETAVWTHQCDEQYCSNLFVMQDTISQKVAAALSLHLTSAERERLRKHYTENKEAYQLYLRGRYHLDKRQAKDFEKSIEYFQQAIRIDSNYAPPYAGLAYAYYALGISAALPKDVVPKAKAAVAKALEIDDQLAEAHAALGGIKHHYDWDRPGAEKAYKRALELNPNSEVVHRTYAIFLMTAGRLDEAFVEINQALDIAPLSIVANRDKALILYHSRQYDAAIEQCRKTLDLDQNFPSVYSWLGQACEAKGDYEQAIAAYLKVATLQGRGPEEIALLRTAYKVSGMKGYWQRRLELMKEQAKRDSQFDQYSLASMYARLGQKEQAFACLEKAYEDRRPFIYLKIDPNLDNLRSDPRFTRLLRRIGLEP